MLWCGSMSSRLSRPSGPWPWMSSQCDRGGLLSKETALCCGLFPNCASDTMHNLTIRCQASICVPVAKPKGVPATSMLCCGSMSCRLSRPSGPWPWMSSPCGRGGLLSKETALCCGLFPSFASTIRCQASICVPVAKPKGVPATSQKVLFKPCFYILRLIFPTSIFCLILFMMNIIGIKIVTAWQWKLWNKISAFRTTLRFLHACALPVLPASLFFEGHRIRTLRLSHDQTVRDEQWTDNRITKNKKTYVRCRYLRDYEKEKF